MEQGQPSRPAKRRKKNPLTNSQKNSKKPRREDVSREVQDKISEYKNTESQRRILSVSLLSSTTAVNFPAPNTNEMMMESNQLLPDKILDLSDQSLNTIPESVLQLDALQVLHLTNNYLQEIPTEICRMKSLQHIYLDENELRSLPREMGNLTNLQSLNLGFNSLKILPQELGKMVGLNFLNVQNNNLSYLPIEIARLNLWGLQINGNPGMKKQSNSYLESTKINYYVPRLTNLCCKYIFETWPWKQEPKISEDMKLKLHIKYKYCSNQSCSSPLLFGSGRIKRFWQHDIADQLVNVRAVYCSVHCCDSDEEYLKFVHRKKIN